MENKCKTVEELNTVFKSRDLAQDLLYGENIDGNIGIVAGGGNDMKQSPNLLITM